MGDSVPLKQKERVSRNLKQACYNSNLKSEMERKPPTPEEEIYSYELAFRRLTHISHLKISEWVQTYECIDCQEFVKYSEEVLLCEDCEDTHKHLLHNFPKEKMREVHWMY
jgi:hypothetical protein